MSLISSIAPDSVGECLDPEANIQDSGAVTLVISLSYRRVDLRSGEIEKTTVEVAHRAMSSAAASA